MLIPLAIPPGVYRNGTDYQASGRWRDASRVRWIDGTMQPIGSWRERVTIAANAPRGAVAWRDLSGDRWIAAGTYAGLFVASAAGAVTDITPVTFTAGSASATVNRGYGGGFYGTGLYGVRRPDSGLYTEATTWSLDNWGEELIACSSTDGRILQWDLNVANNAAVVSGAPVDNLGLVVTEERFVLALGAGGNPRLVQWCDREDNTTWTPAATNEAGDYELQAVGQIMQGIRTRGQTLIITDVDAHAATYQGPPFVYGFEKVGSSCGAISRHAAAAVDAGVFWMGPRGFFRYSGGAVAEVPCDVLDFLTGDINSDQASKVYAVANSAFSEIWWFYPAGPENDSYVAYNYKENHWSIGSLQRTCGVDAGVFSNPIWFASGGVAYDHETSGAVANAFAESGPLEIGGGENVVYATSLIPDEKTQGSVTATFKTRFHPNDTERSYGPYSMTAPTPVRFSGRQFAMRVTGNDVANWRAGLMRLEVEQGGKR